MLKQRLIHIFRYLDWINIYFSYQEQFPKPQRMDFMLILYMQQESCIRELKRLRWYSMFISGKTPQDIFLRVRIVKVIITNAGAANTSSDGYAEAWGVVPSGK